MQKGAFFVRRALVDLVRPYRFDVSRLYDPGRTATDVNMPYVLDYSTKGMLERYDMKLDAEGIAMTRHYLQEGQGYYYSPVKIAHFALASLNDALSGRGGVGMREFRQHLRWVLNHYTEELGGVVWRVPSSAPKYELGYNYISCISQGLALSLLARAEEGMERALARELSEGAMAPLSIPVEEGGIEERRQVGTVLRRISLCAI